MKAMLVASPVQGYLACCEALSTLDQRELLPRIKSPTLVIADATTCRRRSRPASLSAARYRRQPDLSRRRAYFQCRTTPRLHRRRVGF